MDEILKHLVDEYSFLYKEFNFKIVDSLYTNVFGGDSFIILSTNNIQIRFTRDRGQLFIYMKYQTKKWEPLHIIKNTMENTKNSTSFMNSENAHFLRLFLESNLTLE